MYDGSSNAFERIGWYGHGGYDDEIYDYRSGRWISRFDGDFIRLTVSDPNVGFIEINSQEDLNTKETKELSKEDTKKKRIDMVEF